MDGHAIALGLALLGWVCVAFLFVPRTEPAAGRPWAAYGLIIFAVIFFVLGALFAFGWVKA